MSKHFETKEEISDATIKSIVASKSVNQGLFNLRQLFHGRYDMMVSFTLFFPSLPSVLFPFSQNH